MRLTLATIMKQFTLLFLIVALGSAKIEEKPKKLYLEDGGLALVSAARDSFKIEAIKDDKVLVVYMSASGHIQRCNMWSVTEERDEMLKRFHDTKNMVKMNNSEESRNKNNPNQITFDEFASFDRLMSRCETMLQETPKRFRRGSNPYTIFPGTKWCGAGNIAHNETDFGEEVETDMCCHTHDRCPRHIQGFTTKYGYTNFSPYTVTHCNCDDDFLICLRGAGTRIADQVGHWFFNLVRMKCFTTKRVYKCIQWTIPYILCSQYGYVEQATVYKGQRWH